MIKYITSMGQKTGTLKTLKNVQNIAMKIALVPEYQNLNSGNLLMKGRNSSALFNGKLGPSSKSKKMVRSQTRFIFSINKL